MRKKRSMFDIDKFIDNLTRDFSVTDNKEYENNNGKEKKGKLLWVKNVLSRLKCAK